MSTNIIKESEGTVALLTGGSRRIGAEIVEGLAADGADSGQCVCDKRRLQQCAAGAEA